MGGKKSNIAVDLTFGARSRVTPAIYNLADGEAAFFHATHVGGRRKEKLVDQRFAP